MQGMFIGPFAKPYLMGELKKYGAYAKPKEKINIYGWSRRKKATAWLHIKKYSPITIWLKSLSPLLTIFIYGSVLNIIHYFLQ